MIRMFHFCGRLARMQTTHPYDEAVSFSLYIESRLKYYCITVARTTIVW